MDVLEYYPGESVVVRSATEAHMLPAVLRVRVFVQREWSKAPITLSRRNIMLRDKFSCQYAPVTKLFTAEPYAALPPSPGIKFHFQDRSFV